MPYLKALQMYPLLAEAQQDLPGTLRKIREFGYDGVEFAGFYGRGSGELRAMLDEVGLKAVGSHVNYDTLMNDPYGTIAFHKALGCEYIVLGWLDEAHRHTAPGFTEEVLPRIAQVARACREAGVPLAYHNHDFEFVEVNGKNGLDMMMEAIPAEDLKLQLDTGWAAIAGGGTVALLRKYAGRYTTVHLKDFLGDGTAKDFCPIGMGSLDIKPVLRAALNGGARWFVVDQDSDLRHTALEAAKLSAVYMDSQSDMSS